MNKPVYIADLEANGLIEEENGKSVADRIWCLSFCNVKDRVVKSITDSRIIQKFFEQDAYIVMHNGLNYDIRLVEKLLKFKIKATIIDSLGLSWTLFPERNSHGLEVWGESLGVFKPPIIDWNNEKLLPEYINRCNEDVKINLALWDKIEWVCDNLYDNQEDKWRYYEYISFKLKCVALQQDLGVKINIPLIKESLIELEDLKLSKIEALKQAMPKCPIKAKKEMPKVLRKADGSLSANGEKWFEFLKENGLPETHTEPVEYIKGYAEANPNSHTQIKDWLFSLGWNPDYYKYVREEGQSEMRKIPQIGSKDEPGELSTSVKKLIEKEPKLEELSSLGIISHRISIFKGFLRDQRNGRLYQGISGLTPTLRSQHTKIVNLPIPSKPFAENIRKSIVISKEDNVFLGVDLVSIEAKTRNHFMYPFDKAYVEELEGGIDSHIDISIKAGLITEEDGNFYSNFNNESASKEDKERYNKIKKARSSGKVVNFSALYGVSKATLSRNSGMPLKECEKLLEVYWERNKAVKKAVETFKTKQIGSQLWVQNPISKFWLSVRNSKDLFSVVNQNSSTLCFDTFCKYLLQTGISIPYFYHDEWLGEFDKKDVPKIKEKIEWAIKKVNEELKLNVIIQHSLQEGDNYADCH